MRVRALVLGATRVISERACAVRAFERRFARVTSNVNSTRALLSENLLAIGAGKQSRFGRAFLRMRLEHGLRCERVSADGADMLFW